MQARITSKSPHNVQWLKETPIAHRGLHDENANIFENTLSATRAAVDHNYNIEVDLHISSDGVPIVFHDITLDRLTRERGSVRQKTIHELQQMKIMDTQDTIPSLVEFLNLVDGKVAVVLELKGHEIPQRDQGFVGAVAEALSNYKGRAAIMSFDHHLLQDARKIAPHLPLGLTAYKDDSAYNEHMEIAAACNVDFISYELENLDTRFVSEFRETGRPIISWTIKTKEDLIYSNKFADQPTFEGFKP